MHFVTAKGILSAENGMNLYRGCTHGCIYCDSRSVCYGMTHDFEDIEVKENAPALLEASLLRKRKKCMISTGAMCDPYLPAEDKLLLTRQCLGIIDRLGFGAAVLTKSPRVLRDLDLFCSIQEKAKAVVQMTITTYDESLCRILEPGVPPTQERIRALCTLRDAGIPTVVWLCPILPFINDTEENLRRILDACFRAQVKGIVCFGMGVTLRRGNREYFFNALDRSFPGLKARYISFFGDRYECASPNQDKLFRIFHESCRANGVLHDSNSVFSYLHEFPEKSDRQISIFDMP